MEQKDIIITDTIDGIGAREYENYLGHALCLDGECTFEWCGRKMAMHAGDLLIVRRGKLMERIEPDAAFRVKMIYVSASFITLSTPQSNYGMKGQLALFLNPIMHLTPVMFAQCLRLCRQLLDKPLHHAGHLTAVARQTTRVRANLRHLRFLISSLLQPLCGTQSRHEPYGVPGLILFHTSSS